MLMAPSPDDEDADGRGTGAPYPYTSLRVRVQLGPSRGHGSTWTAFSGTILRESVGSVISVHRDDLEPGPDHGQRLIIKLAQPPWGTSGSETRHDLLNECRLVSGVLGDLQGRVVPRFHGLFGSRRLDGKETWCALWDDAGQPVSLGERRLEGVR